MSETHFEIDVTVPFRSNMFVSAFGAITNVVFLNLNTSQNVKIPIEFFCHCVCACVYVCSVCV